MEASIPQDEVDRLIQAKFLNDTTGANDIRFDLHTDKCWADAFWRRRRYLANREDPELQYIQENMNRGFERVLEIGAAYGRVTTKLAGLDKVEGVTGVEICSYLETFASRYIADQEKITMIFDDVFAFQPSLPYDLIVIPMNTVPSFPAEFLGRLFERVKELLQSSGSLVFSTYKQPSRTRKGKYSGELLVETGDIPLAAEFLTFDDQQHDWGIESITYHRYTYMDENFPVDSRLFRTGRFMWNHDVLKQMIVDHDLTVVESMDLGHSSVWQVGLN